MSFVRAANPSPPESNTEQESFVPKPVSREQAKKPTNEITKISIASTDLSTYQSQPSEVIITDDEIEFRGQVFDTDEDISFNQFIHFVPNHDLLLKKDSAAHKLKDLLEVLRVKPNSKLLIIGNAGFDNFEPGDDKTYIYNANGERQRLYFGRGPEVYAQYIDVSDEGHMDILRANNVEPVERLNVGAVMRDRAIAIKKFLVDNGIEANRLSVSKGEFFNSPDRYVSFILKFD